MKVWIVEYDPGWEPGYIDSVWFNEIDAKRRWKELKHETGEQDYDYCEWEVN